MFFICFLLCDYKRKYVNFLIGTQSEFSCAAISQWADLELPALEVRQYSYGLLKGVVLEKIFHSKRMMGQKGLAS